MSVKCAFACVSDLCMQYIYGLSLYNYNYIVGFVLYYSIAVNSIVLSTSTYITVNGVVSLRIHKINALMR